MAARRAEAEQATQQGTAAEGTVCRTTWGREAPGRGGDLDRAVWGTAITGHRWSCLSLRPSFGGRGPVQVPSVARGLRFMFRHG